MQASYVDPWDMRVVLTPNGPPSGSRLWVVPVPAMNPPELLRRAADAGDREAAAALGGQTQLTEPCALRQALRDSYRVRDATGVALREGAEQIRKGTWLALIDPERSAVFPDALGGPMDAPWSQAAGIRDVLLTLATPVHP